MIQSMRPRQWVKNGLLFAGFIFAGGFREPPEEAWRGLAAVITAFVAFCCFSSATYIVNDIIDREGDRAHPEKKHRPIASGRLSVSAALVGVLILVLVGFILAWFISLQAGSNDFLLIACLYVFLTLVYSYLLKHWVIIDVLTLAGGFVLRVVAGCVALPVTISEWLVLCTLFLALFMGFCKRRHELLLLGENNATTRKVLPQYTASLLDQMIAVTAALTIMSYSLYTFTAKHTHFLGRESPWVMLTIPFVIYGVFRYLYLVYRKDQGGTPEDLFSDRPMLVAILLWGLVVVLLSIKVAG